MIPPVIEAPPAETVRAPAEVIVPVPVVAIFPEVEIVPSSEIVRLVTPPDWMSNAVPPDPAFVSFITSACALPAFVMLNEVVRPALSVALISRLAVVAIILPLSYACCNVVPNAVGSH